MKDLSSLINSWIILLVYSGWILWMEFVPRIYRFMGLGGRANSSVLAAIRMTILLLWTYCFVRVVEKKTFSAGFNISFQNWMRSVVWGVIFAVIALAAVSVFQFVIVIPILKKMIAASNSAVQMSAKSRGERLLEYVYVVYEGFIEVLIFIGFLLDRLAARWKPAAALIVSNVGFALWHYQYLKKGLLEGTLMIFLTFLAGLVISLSYLKTRNSLSSVISHTGVDAPGAIMELMGIMP